MLFHPAIMALLLADGVMLLLLVPAAVFAVDLLRHWDLRSGSARQLRLERRTQLVATLLGFIFLTQLLALLLLVFTADALAVQFVGAMCAVGSFNVNGYGFPTLYLKLALFFGAAGWLFMNHVDNRAPDFPLVRVKYGLLLLITPLALAAALVELNYFVHLRADVITSCCGTLFGDTGTSVAGDLSAWPPLPAMAGFYGFMALLLVAGVTALRYRRAVPLFSALGVLAFPGGIAAVVSFASLYIYEHPHHHCPFCLLKAEYSWVGYALYLPLFAASALSFGLAITAPAARAASLVPVMGRVAPRVVAWASGLFVLFTLLVLWFSWHSRLVLLE
jgi:hypothetical protein